MHNNGSEDSDDWIISCDWMKNANQKHHETNHYHDNAALVLRRGNTFKLKATYQGDWIVDDIDLTLYVGKKPEVSFRVGETLNKLTWSLVSYERRGQSFIVEVNIPANAIVRRYRTVLTIVLVDDDGMNPPVCQKEQDVIVLFNPWCNEDTVFMEDEEQRSEYVLNDSGIIYYGTAKHIQHMPWNFGQFEKSILDTVLLLLEKVKRPEWLRERRDPVWICRAMSSLLNSSVLQGKWWGSFNDGKSPSHWSGSVEILQLYQKNRNRVKYGQCWVFSGLLTTVLRALGIPTRSVTNFESGHDTDGSSTIDEYITRDGSSITPEDSIWNFHVWNECWMARKDLAECYGGWQAVDSTQQEKSFGLYQTGPAPVAAIKKGEVCLDYETPFVFAEVNADRIVWIVKNHDDDTKDLEKLRASVEVARSYPRSVGLHISTKKVGLDEREDLTKAYKYAEGTPEERAAFARACELGYLSEHQKKILNLQEEGPTDGIDIEISTFPEDNDHLCNGVPIITFKIDLKNKDTEAKTVTLRTSLRTTTYTGRSEAFVKRMEFDHFKLPAGSTISREMSVLFDDYNGKLVDHNFLRFIAVASVTETKRAYFGDLKFALKEDDCVEIEICNVSGNDVLRVRKTSYAIVKFTNPLPIKLTNVDIMLQGACLIDPIKQEIDEVSSFEKVERIFELTPKRAGTHRGLIADVSSSQYKSKKKIIYVNVEP